MATSKRDRISVDLRGLGPRLLDAARRSGRSPSVLVRGFVEEGLTLVSSRDGVPVRGPEALPGDRSRICLRMAPEERDALFRAAAAAEMAPGRFVATLTAAADQLGLGVERPSMLSSLRECNVELSQLTRSMRHLAALLSTGNVSTALGYRAMLDGVELSVRRHLAVASRALRQVELRRPSARPVGIRPRSTVGKTEV